MNFFFRFRIYGLKQKRKTVNHTITMHLLEKQLGQDQKAQMLIL